MKKKEFIERYGEEKWKERIEKNKKRYWKNRDKVLTKQKEYREKNKEYFQRYREEHEEEIKKQTKNYRELHKEEIKVKQKNYREIHKEEIKKQNSIYSKRRYEKSSEMLKKERSTQFGRASVLKGNYTGFDKKKGFPVDQVVDESWIIENIFKASCIYCGDSDWRHLGADRIDNSKGHTPDNIVCACELCNKERGDRYSIEEFIKLKQKVL